MSSGCNALRCYVCGLLNWTGFQVSSYCFINWFKLRTGFEVFTCVISGTWRHWVTTCAWYTCRSSTWKLNWSFDAYTCACMYSTCNSGTLCSFGLIMPRSTGHGDHACVSLQISQVLGVHAPSLYIKLVSLLISCPGDAWWYSDLNIDWCCPNGFYSYLGSTTL